MRPECKVLGVNTATDIADAHNAPGMINRCSAGSTANLPVAASGILLRFTPTNNYTLLIYVTYSSNDMYVDNYWTNVWKGWKKINA